MEGKERKNPRLEGYDYRARQYYFITICTKNRAPCLCRIEPEDGVVDGEKRIGLTNGLVEGEKTFVGRALTPAVALVKLSTIGKTAEQDLKEIPHHYPEIGVEKYVIMPDHIHMILSLGCREAAAGEIARPTISRVVGNYKGGVSRKTGRPLWQASFYDHIIRGERDYYEIWQYIENNPLRWLLKYSP